jgi:hypothetical protein
MKYRFSASSLVATATLGFVFIFVPACTAGVVPGTNGTNGTDGTNGSSNGNGNGNTVTATESDSGATNPNGGCEPLSGSYKSHYSVANNASGNCTAPTDTTVTFSGSSSTDAGAGCLTNENTATCTFTTSCNSDLNGDTTQSTSDLTVTSDGASGTVSVLVTQDSGGNTVIDCTYDVTYTKQ